MEKREFLPQEENTATVLDSQLKRAKILHSESVYVWGDGFGGG